MSQGIPASQLSDEDLERELTHAHEKRHDIFVGGTVDQHIRLIKCRKCKRKITQK